MWTSGPRELSGSYEHTSLTIATASQQPRPHQTPLPAPDTHTCPTYVPGGAKRIHIPWSSPQHRDRTQHRQGGCPQSPKVPISPWGWAEPSLEDEGTEARADTKAQGHPGCGGDGCSVPTRDPQLPPGMGPRRSLERKAASCHPALDGNNERPSEAENGQCTLAAPPETRQKGSR